MPYLLEVSTSERWAKPVSDRTTVVRVFQAQRHRDSVPCQMMLWQENLVTGFLECLREATSISKQMLVETTDFAPTWDLWFWSQPLDALAYQFAVPFVAAPSTQKALVRFGDSGDCARLCKSLEVLGQDEKRGVIYLKYGPPSEEYGGNIIASMLGESIEIQFGAYNGQAIRAIKRMNGHNSSRNSPESPKRTLAFWLDGRPTNGTANWTARASSGWDQNHTSQLGELSNASTGIC
ncbi:hypothetical protein OIV83_004416 [Microbotryomycetes sp. JL201]|nr:hypothetical protein OIV83_004416 [Microbotryomycetes sp. JL201]